MRAIGYCDTSPNIEPKLTTESFQVLFNSYCDSRGHQPEKMFVRRSTDLGPADVFCQLVQFIKSDSGAFLIVVPDARHIGIDLESIARAVISMSKLESSIVCIEEKYPDILQNAFTYFNVPGVSINKSQNIRKGMQERAISGKSLGKAPFG